MALVRMNWNPEPRQLRGFGLISCDQVDELIREVLLGEGLKFYDADIPAPVGPDQTVTGSPDTM